jgi:hypothetical protein
MRTKPNRFRQYSIRVVESEGRRERVPQDKYREVCLSCEKEKCNGYCGKLRRKSVKEI